MGKGKKHWTHKKTKKNQLVVVNLQKLSKQYENNLKNYITNEK